MKASKPKKFLVKLYYMLLQGKKKLCYFYSKAILFFKGNRRTLKRELSAYKDKYVGKRCFIIGNGPSLRIEDLENLANEITFASNSIWKIFDRTEWRPTFYAAFDEGCADTKEKIEGINSFDCEKKFLRAEGYYIFNKIKGNCCYLNSKYSRKYLENPKFSRDIIKSVYTIGTVTYTLIQIARFMGFQDIYLLGCDHIYAIERTKNGEVINNGGQTSWFYSLKGSPGASNIWEHETAYSYAKQYADLNNFNIYNATRGGKLEVFQRISIDSIN